MNRRRALAALAVAPIAAGCGHLVPSGTAQHRVWPTPQDARYGYEFLSAANHLVVGAAPPELDFAVRELAAEWGVTLAAAAKERHISLEISVAERPGAARTEAGPQGYRLDVHQAPYGARVVAHGGDMAGAFYALQSLRQLGVRREDGLRLRPAAILDWPLIPRRGLITFGNPPGNAASIEAVLALAARFKMNFCMGPEVRPSPGEALVRRVRAFARPRHIEMTALLGGQDHLLKMPEPELVPYFEARAALGFDTLTVNFDDLGFRTAAAAEASARRQLSIALRVHDALHKRVKLIFCPSAYGGLPGRIAFFTPETERPYIEPLARGLPADMPVFWTGDGGVFSRQITAQGAAVMRKLWGRDLFLWDNDPLLFANRFEPLSGRDAALHEEISGYVANLNEHEAQWRPQRNAEFTLVTAALYAWNPPAYSPDDASPAARAAIRETSL